MDAKPLVRVLRRTLTESATSDLDQILRPNATFEMRGESKSTTWEKVDKGLLTPPVRLGPNSVGWPASEIRALNDARIAGFDDEQVRALVRRLMARRAALREQLLKELADEAA